MKRKSKAYIYSKKVNFQKRTNEIIARRFDSISSNIIIIIMMIIIIIKIFINESAKYMYIYLP